MFEKQKKKEIWK